MTDAFLTLDGQPNEVLSRADRNLASANTAHMVQGIGAWAPNSAATALAVLADPSSPFGDSSIRWESVGADEWSSIIGNNPPGPINENTQYVASVWVKSPIATDAVIQATTEIAAETGVVTTLVPDVWTQLWVTILTQPGSATMRSTVSMNWNQTEAPDGTQYQAAAFQVALGTDPTFWPSVRIAGDLDAEIECAIDWQTAAQDLQGIPIQANSGLNQSLNLDELRFAYTTTDEAGHFANFGAPGIADGTRARYRVQRVLSTGESTGFIDDVQVGPTHVGGAGLPVTYVASFPWLVGSTSGGANLTGELFGATIRDGIDGPVVYSMQAADVLAGVA